MNRDPNSESGSPCDDALDGGPPFGRPPRRMFLSAAGAFAAFPASPAAAFPLRSPASAEARGSGFERVLFLHLTGGLAPAESFDPAPEEAAAERRGPWGSIATTLPEVRLSQAFPKLAARLHRTALVRGVEDRSLATHERGWTSLKSALESAVRPAVSDVPACPVRSDAAAFGRGWLELPGPLPRDWAAPAGGATRLRTVPRLRRLLERAVAELAKPVADDSGSDRGPPPESVVVHWPPTCRASGFDLHKAAGGGWESLAVLAAELDEEIAWLLDVWERLPHLHQVTLAIGSEIGRSSLLNRDGGRDHDSSGRCLLFAGSGIPLGTLLDLRDSPSADLGNPGAIRNWFAPNS